MNMSSDSHAPPYPEPQHADALPCAQYPGLSISYDMGLEHAVAY